MTRKRSAIRGMHERKHRRTAAHPESVTFMASADYERVVSLSAAMGLVRCIHGEVFPCAQCVSNRKWNEGAGIVLSEAEFERRYAQPTCDEVNP